MKLLNVEVRKTAKSEEKLGDIYVKALDFDEIQSYFEKIQGVNPDEERLRLVQMCLVLKDGANVFKPQQINVIKNRMIGSHLMKAMLAVTKVNDLESFGDFAEQYEKNSESDQVLD